MSLREFPGLLRQLPQHRPWMIAIGVISCLVVLTACGFGTYQLLKDEATPLGQPTGGAPAQQRDITTREADNVPLTIADVFPDHEVVIDPAYPPYTMIGEAQLSDDCKIAGDSEVRTLLASEDCTQVVRASFNSYDDRYFATAGVLNLLSLESASQFSDKLKSLVDTDQGRLRGYISDPNVNKIFGTASTRLSWQVRGHFLLYVVVVRKDGADMSPDDQGAPAIVDDMLHQYLYDRVMTNWATVKETPPVDATDGATDTAAATSAAG